MRNVYLLIVLFLVVSIIAAEVYIHQMKGPGFFAAPAISQTLWIIEWLAMLLAACIVGIAIGHYLQEKIIQQQHHQLKHLKTDREALVAKQKHYLSELEQKQKLLIRAQENFKEDFKNWAREKERLKEELSSWQNHSEEAKKKYSQAKEEVAKSKEALQKLEQQLETTLAEKEGLQTKLSKSFTLPAKDDLKLIHGIGPGIEKKLNALGIYSFRQISEFTPRTINEVASAIKFFPGRIERDNWVSQARNLEMEKRRQAQ